MRKPTVQYLDRSIIAMPIRYTLCTTEAQYLAEMKRLDVQPGAYATWTKGAGYAATHCLQHSGTGEMVAIVCIDKPAPGENTGPQIAAVLVHEAVHIWQWYCREIGEKEPSDEFMAYGIQYISQELLTDYARQTAPHKRSRRSRK